MNIRPNGGKLPRGLLALFVVALFLASAGSVSAGTVHSTPASAALTPKEVLLSAAALQHSPFLTNPSSVPKVQTTTKLVGTAPSNQPVSFTVGFPIRNIDQLTKIVEAQSTAGSQSYHQWLTLAQEQQNFGADPVEMQNTITYFTSLGFHVQTQGLISVSFTGDAGATQLAFRTSLNLVQNGTAAPVVMNTLPLSLPAPIAAGIMTVNGLEGPTRYHPASVFNQLLANDLQSSLSPSGSVTPSLLAPNLLNESVAFNYTNQAFLWYQYYSHHYKIDRTFALVTPASLNYLYNANPLLAAGYNGDSTGTPITIALVMAGGINPDDMRSFSSLVFNNPNQLMKRLVPVPVDGAFTTNGTVYWCCIGSASAEMALDITWSSTMAPAARIMPVYGPALFTNVLDDDYATIANMGRVPNIISNSWGNGGEDGGPLYGPNWGNSLTMHDYFILLTARGASVIASSGDGGGFDASNGQLAGSWPATDPYVLSINGARTAASDPAGAVMPRTGLQGYFNQSLGGGIVKNVPFYIDSAARMAYQSYWYEPFTNYTLTQLPPQGSGGFGTSYWFNQSWWQHGIGVPNLGRSLGSGVAAEADYNQSIFFDGIMNWGWGGTSFACPTTAGELAIIEDYLLAHGQSAYLGNANLAVYKVGNAFWNGNLSLVPYYDIASPSGTNANGTSFWGNHGVQMGWQWPPGQKFPVSPLGGTTYGNTLPGFDFPTGWGTINVYNFAVDLLTLDNLPGQFQTLNTGGTAWNPNGWANLAMNSTYSIHVNASALLALSNPHVTVKYIPENGPVSTFQPALTYSPTPSNGYTFTLDTTTGVINGAGTVIFEFGNASNPTIGFAYSWIANDLPAGGALTVTVTQPGTSSMVGGFSWFNTALGYNAPITLSPGLGPNYGNEFTVHVTYNGKPVYNVKVDATIASPSLLAFSGSRLEQVTNGLGNPHWELPKLVSESFTNVTGDAFVYTWNMIKPTTYFVNASYGGAIGGTTYLVTPGPNIGTTDAYSGNYSEFSTPAFVLRALRQVVNGATVNGSQPNALNQTAFYNVIYSWKGELLNVTTNDWQGNRLAGLKVWLATLDLGGENKFYHYEASRGLLGVTNVSGTSAITDLNGQAQVYVPDNYSALPFFQYPDGTIAELGFVAASVPGASNRTFSYTEPCFPSNINNPSTQINCQYNDSFSRNYTGAPILVLPNPIDAWTQTSSLVQRDFFTSGANISWGYSASLPNNDPFINGIGTAWLPGVEHITGVHAFVDGAPAGDLSPGNPPNYQVYTANGNLTGVYAPGIHTLTVLVTDSTGHIFTNRHTFIVGAIKVTDLGVESTYTVLPFNMTWHLNIPAGQISNHTFNQSLQIRYVTGACGGVIQCPEVVNLSIKIKDGVADYQQSLNITLLNLKHFYAGAGEPPPGQYQLIVWVTANHSGSIATSITSYLVFDSVAGTINGPAANELLPQGNVTISYAYSGQYVQNSTLEIFAAGAPTVPVFSAQAFVPGIGLRGGAVQWSAVQGGAYKIVLALGTPYTTYNASEWVNVSGGPGNIWLNQSHNLAPLVIVNSAVTATVLALIVGLIGVLLGLFLAPALRSRPSGSAVAAPPRPWEESSAAGAVAAGGATGPPRYGCTTCKEEFETSYALAQHRKIVHGIDE
jgi:subtilase family serine protease